MYDNINNSLCNILSYYYNKIVTIEPVKLRYIQKTLEVGKILLNRRNQIIWRVKQVDELNLLLISLRKSKMTGLFCVFWWLYNPKNLINIAYM